MTPDRSLARNTAGWVFGLVVLAIGIANLLLVHPVPGVACLLVSLVYFPPVDASLRRRCGLSVPREAKVAVGIALLWFTLGVSDLGDMIDRPGASAPALAAGSRLAGTDAPALAPALLPPRPPYNRRAWKASFSSSA